MIVAHSVNGNFLSEDAKHVVMVAAELLGSTSSYGANYVDPEYIRGIVEMACGLIGISTEHSDMISSVIDTFRD